MSDVDTTACDMLDDLVVALEKKGVTLVFAEMKGRVRDKMLQYGFGTTITEDRFFPTMETAIAACQQSADLPGPRVSEATETTET